MNRLSFGFNEATQTIRLYPSNYIVAYFNPDLYVYTLDLDAAIELEFATKIFQLWHTSNIRHLIPQMIIQELNQLFFVTVSIQAYEKDIPVTGQCYSVRVSKEGLDEDVADWICNNIQDELIKKYTWRWEIV